MILSFLTGLALAAPPLELLDEPFGDGTEDGAVDPMTPDDGPLRVIGGVNAEPGAWPDAAALLTGAQGSYACMGTLIAPRLVLTAAHCNWNVRQVVVDTTTYQTDGQVIDVIDDTSHPQSWSTYDIAVLRLAEPATAEPRIIARDCITEDYLDDEAEVAIVGWGAIRTNATGWPDDLQEARAAITDHDCSELASGCNERVSPGGEIIAGGDGVDSCNGDSGGPLYLVTPLGDYLIGVTSRAASPATAPCGDGGIYVRADAMVDWIERQTGTELPRPDCDQNRRPKPTAEELVVKTISGSVPVLPNDPNPEDHHQFRILEGPQMGSATIDAQGVVTYWRTTTFFGHDRLLVEVSDDGDPMGQGTVEVSVLALPWIPGAQERPGACACGTGGPPVLWAPWLALLLGLRRRRPGPR